MRGVLLNTWVLTLAMVVLLGGSLCYALQTEMFMWFSRAGSVTAVVGLLLTMKHNVLSSSRDIHVVVMEKRHYAVYAPGRESEAYRNDVKYARRVMRDEYIGLVSTVFGTIVWGYGDAILAQLA